MTIPSLVAVMTDLALAAGREIMAVYHRGDVAADTKADDSPVTEADLAADRVIGQGLARSFPRIPVVTEEAADSHKLTGSDRFFLVDPLDGTKEFIRRRADFTVNIALIEDGVPVAGVVYAPAKDRLFRTRDGSDMGVWAEEIVVEKFAATGPARRLAPHDPDNAALLVVASKSHRDAETDAFIAGLPVAETKSAGSSLKFCLLAAGEADLYPRFGRTMEWDTAAGDAVLRAVGGQVLEAGARTPLTYGKAGWENPHFLAMVPGVEI